MPLSWSTLPDSQRSTLTIWTRWPIASCSTAGAIGRVRSPWSWVPLSRSTWWWVLKQKAGDRPFRIFTSIGAARSWLKGYQESYDPQALSTGISTRSRFLRAV